jgi:predicted permease
MGTFLQNLRYAVRLLIKSPGFTAVALVSLALGIGANTTVFSIVNAVLLSPLPVKEASRLVAVFTTDRANDEGGFFAFLPVSRLNFLDYREKNQVFEGMTASVFTQASLSRDRGEPEQLTVEMVSGDYFSLLGVTPAPGRGFLPDEDKTPGARPVAVLSYGLWQRRFGGNHQLIGQTISLNSYAFTVVGVAPAGFRGTAALGGPDLWAPAMTYPQLLTGFLAEGFEDRRALICQVAARLKPGVTVAQAQANLKAVASQLEQEYPTPNAGRTVTIVPLAQATINPGVRGNFVAAGGLLMTIVALVLLIACANLANLLLARASGRQREVAVRVSLGADRRQLLGQFLTESTVLSLAGGAAGLLLAFWAQHVLWSMRPAFLTANVVTLALDWRVLAFTVVISVATGVLFGLAPAMHASRADLVNGLKERSVQPGGSTRGFSLRNALVVGQVALSLVALLAAGLFLRSLANAQRIDPGFEPTRLAVLSFDLAAQGYNEERGREFLRQVRDRMGAMPGVEAVTFGTSVPLSGGGPARTVFLEGQDATDRRNGRFVQLNTIDAGYFKTMSIPLKRGRDFADTDRPESPRVVIVNETMTRQFWPGEDAIGKRFRFYGQQDLNEVVGVARDIKYNFIGEAPQPFAYLPLRQLWDGGLTLHVRTTGDPAAVMGTVRQELQQRDRSMPITNVFTVREVFAQSLWAPRMSAILLGIFALLSLTLAVIGLYGLMAYEVSQRTREMGIRVALGANRHHVLGLVVRHAMTLALTGIALGLSLAFVASRFIASLLYDVSPTDVVTYVVIPLILTLAALAASYLPARRATRVDPVIALRFE